MQTRIVVIGGPSTGKTTYCAGFMGASFVRCTDPKSLGGDVDDHLELPVKERWSAASADVTGWFNLLGPWVIEGCGVARALRKWKLTHPGLPYPCDEVHLLLLPKVELTSAQASMGKGILTVLDEILPWLKETALVVSIATIKS